MMQVAYVTLGKSNSLIYHMQTKQVSQLLFDLKHNLRNRFVLQDLVFV